MAEAVVAHQKLALRAFAGAGPAEDEDYRYGGGREGWCVLSGGRDERGGAGWGWGWDGGHLFCGVGGETLLDGVD